jgi:glycosyltransferase involved in cell wall biosynthesis
MSATPITVCMFDNEQVRGGAEEHMLCLLRGLDRRRFRPLLVCSGELLARLRPDLPDDVEAVPLALQSHRQLGQMRALHKLLERERVQVLHSHGFRPSVLASPVGRCAGVPVIVETPHVREYWRKGWKSSFVIDRLAGRFVDHYIAVSAANRKYLVEEKGLPESKIALIRNGCDVERFDRAHAVAEDSRRLAGFAESDPVLLVVARLEPQKGHWVLLRAMARLKSEFPNLRLVALGEGSLRAGLEGLVRELGLEDSVLMPGHCADVRDWMTAADVCVLPSFAEGLPLFAIECLAAGRPMVASAVDGTPEIVIDGKTGLTVAAGDPVALAQAIARLLRNPQMAAQLGAAGAEWVRQCFTLKRQIQETEALYERLWCAKTGNTLPSRREESAPQPLLHC